MGCLVLDVTRAESIRSFVRRLISEYPSLNCVINNAGVQTRVSFSVDGELHDEGLRAEINTNLLGPMRIAAAVLPHLVRLGEGKSPVKPGEGLSGPRFLHRSYFDQCFFGAGVCAYGAVSGLLRY